MRVHEPDGAGSGCLEAGGRYLGVEGQIMSVYDRAAASYERVGPPFFSYFGRRVVDMVGVPEASRVLDVACGAGAVLLAAVERIGPRGVVVGVDRANAMVDRARRSVLRGITVLSTFPV
jgi:ubiquinone/menaquinone biosynthesis C-methylase UbiE